MSKVYLVNIDRGAYDDYHWWIESVWSSPEKAEGRKLEISKKIELNKLHYLNKFGSTFENDQKYIDSGLEPKDFDEVEYDSIVDRVCTFEFDNPELQYNNINVVEKQVL